MQDRFQIRKGVNLGGWMSQCDYSDERLDTFIREEDIKRIASWGLDHVRLPLDYNVLDRPDGYSRIDRAIGWCQENGLKVVLDLHKTRGYSFDEGEAEAGFFDSEAYQEAFYGYWIEMAKRWGSLHENVAFELLNEVTSAGYMQAWNRIAGECIRRIREVAPLSWILVGGYDNNSAHAVPAIALPEDDRLILNFHCYLPLHFTHQGAYWVPFLDRDKRVSYEEAHASEDYFEGAFTPALMATHFNPRPLYCGEYGVIDLASPEDTLRWYRAIHAVFERHGIARAAWSYKGMDFGLTDPRLDGMRDELITLL